MKIRIFCVYIALSLSCVVLAQVNTENLRKYNADRGFHHTVGFSLGLQEGNSESLSMKSNYRLDWLTSAYYSFFAANYERAESRGKLYSHKGFMHLRVTRNLSDYVIAEGFTQKEFNAFIDLKDRQLIGSGLRYEIMRTDSGRKSPILVWAVGAGLMWEREMYEHNEPTTRKLRSTNYLSIRWNPDDRLAFVATTYYQADTRKFSDYRLLHNTNMSIALWKKLSFVAAFNARYDHRPAPGIRTYDMELSNGVNIVF
ncbi:MAG TPA: DUF481 domain-containing protein [bacterium]|nr:DUF481 domain-containing protein [bacterium]